MKGLWEKTNAIEPVGNATRGTWEGLSVKSVEMLRVRGIRIRYFDTRIGDDRRIQSLEG